MSGLVGSSSFWQLFVEEKRYGAGPARSGFRHPAIHFVGLVSKLDLSKTLQIS